MGQRAGFVQQAGAIEPRAEICCRIGCLGIAQGDQSTQPADSIGVEVGHVEVGAGRLIEALMGGVADEAAFFFRRALVVARTHPNVRLPMAFDSHPHRLVEAGCFVDPERQHPALVEAEEAGVDGRGPPELVRGPAGAQQVVLEAVDVGDTLDFVAVSALPDTEHQPTAAAVGEGGDGLEGVPGDAALGRLDFEGDPFGAIEAF